MTAAVARPTTLAGIATGSNGLGCWLAPTGSARIDGRRADEGLPGVHLTGHF